MAVEIVEPKGFGRIRLRRIDRDAATHVIPFVQEVVEPGAQVRTDGSAAYRALGELGYTHQRTVMLGSGVPAHVSMAGVHRVASLVQRWVLGTHHGSVQPDHLDAYLDEFVFRFNRRTSSSRGMLFYRLLQQAVVTPPVTYGDVVSKNTGERQSDTISTEWAQAALQSLMMRWSAPPKGFAAARAAADGRAGGARSAAPRWARWTKKGGEPAPTRSIAVIQAGTGVGKSLAYCAPAIALALARGTRVLISTATVALQEQLVSKDLPHWPR